MADFTSAFWGVLIALVTLASLVALFVFARAYSTRKTDRGDTSAESMGHVWDEDLEEMNNPLPRWWINLFYITLVWGGVYLILYPGLGAFPGLLGWTQVDQYEREVARAEDTYGPLFEKYLNQDLKQVAADPEALAIGRSLFSTYCTTCHGSDAGGARGFPNLRDDDWLYGGEPDAIKTTILNGRQGIMPGWAPILGDEKLAQVVAYVRRLAGHDVAGDVTAGKQVYDTSCAACHGPEGQGNPLMGAPNLADDIWLYGGSESTITESVAQGRTGNMPPHKEFLGEAKAHLLAAYVYSLPRRD